MVEIKIFGIRVQISKDDLIPLFELPYNILNKNFLI